MADWQLVADPDALALTAVRQIRAAATEAIARRGIFKLVLAGGSSPLQVYRKLAQNGGDLSAWHLFYGDERCLPADHPERNSRMVEQTGLTARVGAHYPIPAELGAEQAADRYAELVRNVAPFDLVLLGMGEDGHTASLFPGQHWPDGDAIPVHGSPKPPPERVSLTPSALQRCRKMLVLVSGDGKREALNAWREGADLPVARVADLERASILVPAALLENAA